MQATFKKDSIYLAYPVYPIINDFFKSQYIQCFYKLLSRTYHCLPLTVFLIFLCQ